MTAAPLDYARRAWMKAVFAATFLFLYFPIAALVVFSFNDSARSVVWEGFTFAHYVKAYGNEALHEAFANSLVVALASSAIATVLGAGLGVGLQRWRFPGRAAFEAWLHLPVVIPEICMGVALLAFFAALDIDLGLPTVIAGHVAFSIPFVALVVRARYRRFDPALAEASRDLGASEWQTFRRIVLPYLTPALAAGALLAFTLSIDDFVITFFTTGPGSTTLPVKIYSMVRLGVSPEINAASTVLITLTAALVVLATRLQGRGALRP